MLDSKRLWACLPEVRKALVGQSFSALSASSLEYLSSVCSAHSLAEAVVFLSLKLFRLVCSKHFCVTPFPWRLMTFLYIIYIFYAICQVFCAIIFIF